MPAKKKPSPPEVVEERGTHVSNDLFNGLFAKFDGLPEPTHNPYPFRVCCGVVKRRPPRHAFFEYMRDHGQPNIERVFRGEPLSHPEELTFVFPERWMGVIEQQAFTHTLTKHPDAGKIKRLNLLTSSPLLVGSFMREQVLIMTFDDDNEYEGQLEPRHAEDKRMAAFG